MERDGHIAALFLSAMMPLAVAAEPLLDWTWSESTCAAAGGWLTFKGSASVVFQGNRVVAELYERETGTGLRHKASGKLVGGKLNVVLSTMNTDSGDLSMVGKYSRKVLKEFAGAPLFESITLTEGCSFIGLTRITGGSR